MGSKKRGLTGEYVPTEKITPDTLFRVTAPAPMGEGEPVKYRLEDIRPDPQQARRILPEDLAGKLAAGEMGPREAIEAMVGQAEEAPVVAKRLAGLRELATSIQNHGLINPVTLHWVGGDLLIETGERRYWAHWLLVLDGHREFMEIRGELVAEDTNVTARQLIENWQREDLNVVEKAKGLWALRYELSGVTPGTRLADAEDAEDTGEVTPGTPLVPWKTVEEVLELSKRHRIRLLKVLALCPKAQALTSQFGLTEKVVRPIAERLLDSPDLQVKALEQAGKKGLSATEVERLVDQLLRVEEVESKSSTPPRPSYFQDLKRGLRASLRVFDRAREETELDAVLSELVTTPDYAEVGELAAELEPLVHDLAERWRAAQQ